MIDRACISLNARCNLNCSYCHFAAKKNNAHTKENEFTLDNVGVFCDNLHRYVANNGIQSFKLGIVGSGEPLLSFPQLKAIVRYFYDSDPKDKIRMYTITNGTLFDDEVIDFFYDYKSIIELNVSVDGDPELNGRLRGAYPNLEIYRRKFGEMPKVNAVVTKEIIRNKERVLSYFVKNQMRRINFSKVFATDDPEVAVSDTEYVEFLARASELGIESRQNVATKRLDCAKYGNLCGVGQNNIFIAKTGVYPCGRFMDIAEYRIGDWNEPLADIERRMKQFASCPHGECYFDYNKVGV